jgi:hypothetical protein
LFGVLTLFPSDDGLLMCVSDEAVKRQQTSLLVTSS